MSIVKETEIRSSLGSVWEAWTRSEKVARWFAPAAEVEPFVGGKYEVYFNPADKDSMSTRGCKVLSVEQEERIVFEWKGPDQYAEIMNRPGELTAVEVEFRASDDRVRVTLTHRGWQQSDDWTEARTWHERAWDDVLSSLKNWLEADETQT